MAMVGPRVPLLVLAVIVVALGGLGMWALQPGRAQPLYISDDTGALS